MSHHIVPIRVYLTIISILMVLTALTVAVAYVDLGQFNILVAMSIAVVKALLVVMFFMHMKYAVRTVWLFAIAGVLWFTIMIVLTLADYRTRDWQYQPQPWNAAAEAPAETTDH